MAEQWVSKATKLFFFAGNTKLAFVLCQNLPGLCSTHTLTCSAAAPPPFRLISELTLRVSVDLALMTADRQQELPTFLPAPQLSLLASPGRRLCSARCLRSGSGYSDYWSCVSLLHQKTLEPPRWRGLLCHSATMTQASSFRQHGF